MAVEQENRASILLNSIETKLKLFEESRLKSFVNKWTFDENEKCSATEVKFRIFYVSSI